MRTIAKPLQRAGTGRTIKVVHYFSDSFILSAQNLNANSNRLNLQSTASVPSLYREPVLRVDSEHPAGSVCVCTMSIIQLPVVCAGCCSCRCCAVENFGNPRARAGELCTGPATIYKNVGVRVCVCMQAMRKRT